MEVRQPVAPEGQRPPELSLRDKLSQAGWTALGLGRNIHTVDRDDRVVSELSRPTKEVSQKASNATATAYYAFELGTNLLPLTELRREPVATDQLRHAVSLVVARELIAANNVYKAVRFDRENQSPDALARFKKRTQALTADQTRLNNAALHSLAKMSSLSANRPSLPQELSHDAETLLRMFLAKYQGLIDDYDDLLKIQFDDVE